ncbi:MAG: hypothetical protein ACODAG_08110 [Myxococcota bacterium]
MGDRAWAVWDWLRDAAKVVVGAVIVLIILSAVWEGSCEGDTEDVMDVAPCARTVAVIRDLDPDVTEDRITSDLEDMTDNRVDLAETCSAMLMDLCERFDPPSCSGPLVDPEPGSESTSPDGQ